MNFASIFGKIRTGIEIANQGTSLAETIASSVIHAQATIPGDGKSAVKKEVVTTIATAAHPGATAETISKAIDTFVLFMNIASAVIPPPKEK